MTYFIPGFSLCSFSCLCVFVWSIVNTKYSLHLQTNKLSSKLTTYTDLCYKKASEDGWTDALAMLHCVQLAFAAVGKLSEVQVWCCLSVYYCVNNWCVHHMEVSSTLYTQATIHTHTHTHTHTHKHLEAVGNRGRIFCWFADGISLSTSINFKVGRERAIHHTSSHTSTHCATWYITHIQQVKLLLRV